MPLGMRVPLGVRMPLGMRIPMQMRTQMPLTLLRLMMQPPTGVRAWRVP